MRKLALFLALAWLGPAVALAQAAKISNHDQTFLNNAMEAGIGEITLARLAERRTHDAAVRAFAARTIRDHAANDAALRALARRLDTHLPAGPTTAAQGALIRLVKLSGHAFDRAYLAEEVRMQRRLLAEFRAELRESSNPQIDAYVRRTIPVLSAHLRLAEADLGRT